MIFPLSAFVQARRHLLTSQLLRHSRGLVYSYSTKPDRGKRELPEYISARIDVWNRLKSKYVSEWGAKPQNPINITLTDGEIVGGISWRSTPYGIMRSINQNTADTAIVAKVNNQLWDMSRPLEGDCHLELVNFNQPEGLEVYWHSSAHVLGKAIEQIYGGQLCCGPATENGFYYDVYLGENAEGISTNDIPVIESAIKQITKEKHQFERLEVSKEDLLKIFAANKFKLRIINEKILEEKATIYRCGWLIDLCRGPHIRHSGLVKAIKLTKTSSAHWQGNPAMESLQRIAGISFPDQKQLTEWEKFQKEAARRDHRKIGREQQLFFFHELSPGSCFFQPRGTHIYNTLLNFLKAEYRKRGFHEVITPNIFSTKLWETSGHWEHFGTNMFTFETEKSAFALKPMNCPGHCLMFNDSPRSWRELPLRLADFGVLHRNEISGALTGLTRVRRFQQDDAHIFCSEEQIQEEIDGCLDFLSHVYKTFGYSFKLVLSTRPESFLGNVEMWDEAEKALENSLNKFGQPWSLNPGDGAFYGPKIDITITDALKRAHQCATIQLDFQLPIRFNLTYTAPKGEKRQPVIIHRAILGSVERQIAMLTENYAGKWPFWLSPRQVMVVPIAETHREYAESIRKRIHDAGFMVDADGTNDTINKKIRNAQTEQYNFILVVGDKERANNTVNIRTRDNKVHGEMIVEDLLAKFEKLRDERVLEQDQL